MKRIVLALCLLTGNSFAADYYVSSIHANRSDSNPGTSTNAPWETIDYAKAQWNSFSAGDTLHLERGSSWDVSMASGDYWSIGSGGSAGAHKTIRGDDYGNPALGKPILRKTSTDSGHAFFLVSGSYVTIRDLELDANGLPDGAIGVAIGYGTGNFVYVLNNRIKSDGDTTPYGNYTSGIWLVGGSDCLISNNFVSGYSASGLNQYGGSLKSRNKWVDNVVSNSHVLRFSDASNGIHFDTYQSSCVFEGNWVHDATAIDAQFIYFHKNGSSDNALTVRHNVFVTTATSAGLYIQGEVGGFRGLIDFYGNVIYAAGSSVYGDSGIFINGQNNATAGTVYNIYNNSVVCGGTGSEAVNITSANLNATINFDNNLLYQNGIGYIISVASGFNGTLAHGYNAFYKTGAGNGFYDRGLIYTLAQATSFEANCQYANPEINTALYPTNVSTTAGTDPDGLAPTNTGSCLVDTAGAQRSAYSNSIDLITRPYGSGWDIGAYELGTNTAPVVPPDPPVYTGTNSTSGIRIGSGQISNMNSIVVSSVTFTNLGTNATAISIAAASGKIVDGVTITNCAFSKFSDYALDHNATAGVISNTLFSDNRITSPLTNAIAAIRLATGGGSNVFEHNYISGAFTNGSVALQNGPGSEGALIFKFNVVRSNTRGAALALSAKAASPSNMIDGVAFGNIITGNYGPAVKAAASNTITGVLKFYNNTIYANATDAIGYTNTSEFFVAGDNDSLTNELQNNLIYTGTNGACVYIGSGEIVHSNNLFWSSLGISGLGWGDTSTWYTVGTIANIESTAKKSDPSFTDGGQPPTSVSRASGTFPDGLYPALNSPAVDSGASLGDDYADSIDGQNRPFGYGWDIGAYECNQDPPLGELQVVNAIVSTSTVPAWLAVSTNLTGFTEMIIATAQIETSGNATGTVSLTTDNDGATNVYTVKYAWGGPTNIPAVRVRNFLLFGSVDHRGRYWFSTNVSGNADCSIETLDLIKFR